MIPVMSAASVPSTIAIGRTEKTYVIMYHLMDDSVINLILRKVKPPAYAYLEVRILQTSVPFAVLAEGANAQISLGVGDGYRRFRESAVKHRDVKLPELLLNVFYCRYHSMVSRLRLSM